MSTDAIPLHRGSFWHSLAIQRRVIGALMMREVITRFGRHNLGALWIVGEPMLFTLGIATLWSGTGLRHDSDIPIVAFAITGYSSVLAWRNTVTRCSHAVQQNLNLLYHRNVKVIDVLITRVLLEIGGATTSFVVLTLVFVSGEWITPPKDLMLVVAGWLMMSWFGLGLGLTIGAATAYSPIVERVWHPTSYLLFPLSGAAYMAAWLPSSTRDVLLLLPMPNALELIREGFFGDVMKYYHDMGYMAMCNLALTLSGLWLVRDAGFRVETE
jgi:ABC-type polysaccharide/polyol phosphate export permease